MNSIKWHKAAVLDDLRQTIEEAQIRDTLNLARAQDRAIPLPYIGPPVLLHTLFGDI